MSGTTLTDQDFSLYAGDNKTIEFALVDEDDEVLPITGASIEWVLWDGNTIVLRKTVGDGVTITNGPGGVLEVSLLASDTYALTPKVYTHGMNISLTAGHYKTVSTGALTLMTKVRQ